MRLFMIYVRDSKAMGWFVERTPEGRYRTTGKGCWLQGAQRPDGAPPMCDANDCVSAALAFAADAIHGVGHGVTLSEFSIRPWSEYGWR